MNHHPAASHPGGAVMRWMPAVAVLFAAMPVMGWYARRMAEGGDELQALVPLAAALLFLFRDRRKLLTAPMEQGLSLVPLALYALLFPWLPDLIRALLMIAVLAFLTGIRRRPGILLLLVLALPWAASLDFFLGYPLRLLTSVNAKFLLETAGLEVVREGVQLLHDGRVVGVEAACDGMNMLWSTGLMTALLAAIFSLRWQATFALGGLALLLAIAGNSLRAAILFFPESGLIDMPHILHPGIGLAIAVLTYLPLLRIARRFASVPAVAASPRQPSTRIAVAVTLTALLAVAAPHVSHPRNPGTPAEPPALTHFQGQELVAVELGPVEEKFYRNFPGSIAVYQARDFRLIVRRVTRATRKLHPASHCLRAEGYEIGEKTVGDAQWLSYRIAGKGEILRISERIREPSSGKAWPDISAWYWHALFHPAAGDWEAITVIAMDEARP